MTGLLGVLLAPFVVLAELGARIVYQRPWYDRRSGSREKRRSKERKSNYATSRWGGRGTEYDRPVEEGVIRILVLGDSFTDGRAVGLEATHPKVMERRLNADAPAGIRYEVANAGWAGSLTAQWVSTLRQALVDFQPDLVLTVYYMRDGTFIGSIPAFFDRIRQQFRKGRNLAYRISYLYRRAVDPMHLSIWAERFGREYDRAYFGSEAETVEWRMARENLRQLAAMTREQGAEFVLANFPTLFRLDPMHPFGRIYDAIETFARKCEIPYIDLYPAFEGKDAARLWVAPDDQHPNVDGHRIAGEYLARSLKIEA